MKKKLVCLILAGLMVLSIMPASVFAAQVKCERPLQFEENIATELKKLNLFKGVSETDFALRKVPTRIEALVIMLRLMGKESEILAGAYTHPFTDVPSWANNYVGYAYENGLTKGISASKFGTDNATDVQFLTFVLRAMGYSDADGDFTWDNPYKLAEDLGVLDCSVTTGKGFLRADCASISYNALDSQLKEGGKTLADKLIADKVFTKSAYDAAVKNVPDYAGMLKAYGLDNVKWHEYPSNGQELDEDFLYSFLTGNFSFDQPSDILARACKLRDFGRYVYLHDSILDILVNIAAEVYYTGDGFHITLNGGTSPLTPKEVSDTLVASYIEAKKLYDAAHAKNLVRDGMSDLEIAKAYSDYLNGAVPQVPHPSWFTITADNFDPIARTQSMQSDGVYNVLISHWGQCAPHAATFDLFMNMEGVRCISAHCHVNGAPDYDGHLVSVFYCDGTEYMCDWFNKVGVMTITEYSKRSVMEDGSMNNFRVYFDLIDEQYTCYWMGILNGKFYSEKDCEHGKGTVASNSTELPDIYWEYVKRIGNNDYYFVKLADGCEFSVPDSTKFVVMYHSERYGHNINCTFNQLRTGFEVKIPDSVDASLAKQNEYFLNFKIRKP